MVHARHLQSMHRRESHAPWQCCGRRQQRQGSRGVARRSFWRGARTWLSMWYNARQNERKDIKTQHQFNDMRVRPNANAIKSKAPAL